MSFTFKKILSWTTVPILISLTPGLASADSTTNSLYRAKMGDALVHVAKRAATMNGPEMAAMGLNNEIILADVSQDNFVTLDLVAKNKTEELVTMLDQLGARNMSSFGRIVSAQVPANKLFEMAESEELAFVQPMLRATNAGLVQQQGDRSMGTDTTRSSLGLDGSGFTVGVLSDSFECDPGSLAGAAYTTPEEDVINGDIPATYQNLAPYSNLGRCTDEGRAIAQLIYDILPGANILFHTAFNGQADFAQGIIELAEAGADVIVDDVIYFAEPMFQDGIIAQAADQVAKLGIPFYSSAMNFARISYESDYRPVSANIDGIEGIWHDWDPSENTDTLEQVFLDGTLQTTLSFQWDSPNFSVSGGTGTPNDVDVIVFDQNNNKLVNCFENLDADGNFPPLCQYSSTLSDDAGTNLGGDAIELVQIYDELGGSEIQLGIFTRHGEAPGLVKYVAFRGIFLESEYPLDAPTSYGHSAAEGAESVGAAAFYFTEEFIDDPFTLMLRRLSGEPDCIPACLNIFSSAGGIPILFDTQGNRLSQPEVRFKPGITAPDAANTTFFFDEAPEDDDDRDGEFIFNEPGEFPNFYGTSAAAPNAATIAVQMLQAVTTPVLHKDRFGKTLYWMCKPVNGVRKPGFTIGVPEGRVDSKLEQGFLLGKCNRPDPQDIYLAMRTTAEDMSTQAHVFTGETVRIFEETGIMGFDFDSGFGMVNAPASIDAILENQRGFYYSWINKSYLQ